MKIKLGLVLTAIYFLCAGVAFAKNTELADNDVPDGQVEVATPAPAPIPESPSTKPRELLNFGLRIDSSLSEGGPTDQGFSIPSVRLTGFGDVTDNLNYRLSLGQTREFSSAQLPQILPVEAYVDFISAKKTDIDSSRLDWKGGMFTPSFNPWWTPDLSDIEMPDYLDTHRALFLSRDIGTELSYEFRPEGFKIGAGAFNGDGIVALNTNNSIAFTGFARELVHLAEEVTMEVGVSAYTLHQSSSGSINYKEDWAGDLYVDFNVTSIGLHVMGEGFLGNFQDSISNYNSQGGSLSVSLSLLEWLKVFGRFETLNEDPSNQGAYLNHFQIGPILKLDEAFKIYSFYEYYDHGDGNIENSFQIRARLVI